MALAMGTEHDDRPATDSRRPATDVAAIVGSAAVGDRLAWAQLVEEFQGLLWAVARAHRLGYADAADVIQTTWMRLVENLDSLLHPHLVGGWLATTARRECLRVLRKSSREVPCEELREPDAETPKIDGDLLRVERDAAVWEAFGRLRESDQALLRMLVADPSPSYEEVSAALGMPIGSIGPTRARALERLQRELGREGFFDSLIVGSAPRIRSCSPPNGVEVKGESS
jgi:RNA polymerase sigma factor (sigma-70 family)